MIGLILRIMLCLLAVGFMFWIGYIFFLGISVFFGFFSNEDENEINERKIINE